MIRQAVPYGNNSVSKIIFPYVVMTVMLNKLKFKMFAYPLAYDQHTYFSMHEMRSSGTLQWVESQKDSQNL